MKCNYHTHTWRCRHANGADEDYVVAAIEHGFDVMGFSDHVAYPYQDYVPPYRMLLEERDGYFASVAALRKKYAGKIRVLTGFECEMVPKFKGYLTELRSLSDYLILGNHGDESDPHYRYNGANTLPEHMREYTRTTLQGMEWGIFACLAHPDLTLHSYPVFDDVARDMSVQIARAAKALNMPLEYNLNGMKNHLGMQGTLGYPCRAFWEIAAAEGATAIIGVDAHDPEAYGWTWFDEGKAYLQSLGMTVLDALPGLV